MIIKENPLFVSPLSKGEKSLNRVIMSTSSLTLSKGRGGVVLEQTQEKL